MIGHSTSRVTQRDWLLRPSLTKSDANCRATTRRGALLLGNDAWKGVELGVESSLRWRDEFKSFTRKVKAINDTDDVVDEVVIFSNKRFTKLKSDERERLLPFSLSPMHISLEISLRDFTCPRGFQQSLPRLPVNSRNGRGGGEKSEKRKSKTTEIRLCT